MKSTQVRKTHANMWLDGLRLGVRYLNQIFIHTLDVILMNWYLETEL